MQNLSVQITIWILAFILVGCSSSKLTQQYKNPDSVNFQANKVLIVGISADKETRRTYEKKMLEALEKEEIIAVKSIDFFEKSFTDNKQSLEQLSAIEGRLLEAGFDAILFAKVTGQESRVTLVDSYRKFARDFQTYQSYMYENQHIYYKEHEERYQVYTTETSLYCICPGKERELIWRGEIEVVDGDKVNRNINSYINILFKALKESNTLILEE
jgi:hypothetical protein